MSDNNNKKNKPILRSDKQRKMAERNEKLNNHINEGVKDYVQDLANNKKEARKNQRWYETGQALLEAELNAEYEADKEFAEEFKTWASNREKAINAEVEAQEKALIYSEDDVIDVDFKPLFTPTQRQSLLTPPENIDRTLLLPSKEKVNDNSNAIPRTSSTDNNLKPSLEPKPHYGNRPLPE